MKARKLIGTGLVVCAAGAAGAWGATSVLQPEGDHPGKKFVEQRMAEMGQDPMQAWMEAGTPGLAHEILAISAGEWDAVNRVWMAPGAEPMESTASASMELVMDGRFVKTRYEGSIMGAPFTGMGLMGYDNTRKLFTSLWIDSMSTSMSMAYGSLDETGTILTFVGTMDEPTTGEIGKSYKQVLRMIDEDHSVFEMWEILYGEPFKVMEIEYTRK